jgi:hypothetical protein
MLEILIKQEHYSYQLPEHPGVPRQPILRKEHSMTAPTAQFDEFATKAQEQVSAAVRAWADAVTSAADSLVAERPALVDAKDLVEKYFDYAQLVLDNQRQFAHSVLAAGTEATQTATEQTVTSAKTATAQAVSAVESAVENGAAEKPAVAAPRKPRVAAKR